MFNEAQFLSSLIQITNSFLAALRRQINDFLDEGIFGEEISGDVKNILDSCPLTNLFGDFEFDIFSYLRVRS